MVVSTVAVKWRVGMLWIEMKERLSSKCRGRKQSIRDIRSGKEVKRGVMMMERCRKQAFKNWPGKCKQRESLTLRSRLACKHTHTMELTGNY